MSCLRIESAWHQEKSGYPVSEIIFMTPGLKMKSPDWQSQSGLVSRGTSVHP